MEICNGCGHYFPQDAVKILTTEVRTYHYCDDCVTIYDRHPDGKDDDESTYGSDANGNESDLAAVVSDIKRRMNG